MPAKLVLAVIDGLVPEMLERAVASGRAPALRAIAERGSGVERCVSAFPSVTPVCAATIATGELQDRHLIPSMNWYSRAEERYVEYGSSLAASRRAGLVRQLTDTVYEMNAEHLAGDVETVFETLDDRGVRTAGTTYLIYRGRHRHEISRATALTRAIATLVRRPVMGPRELFYADVFASRETGCRAQLGMPGLRDQHAGCVGAHLVEHDLFDFLLLSLPDNDAASHRGGLDAQLAAAVAADRQLERLMHAGGGADAFLEEHAVIVVSDHGHAHVDERIELARAFDDLALLTPSSPRGERAQLALCPAQRAAMLYALGDEARAPQVARLVERARGVAGVDLAIWRAAPREGAIAGGPEREGELRFAPGGDLRDERGRRWSLEGSLALLGAEVVDGVVRTPTYPDALARCWAALTCPTSGDVLLSAAPGWEFPDWGGVAHVGGGSHGSLRRDDSLAALAFCGLAAPAERADGAWSIADVAALTRSHFGA